MKRIAIIALILFAGIANGQDKLWLATNTSNTSNVGILTVSTSLSALAIYDHDKLTVSIDLKTGKPTFGEGIDPDDATRDFWTKIGNEWMKRPCKDGE